MLRQHGNVLRGEEGRRSPPRDHGHGHPRPLEERESALEELPRGRLAIGKGHETPELHAGEPRAETGQIEGGRGRLHAGATESRVALDEKPDVDAVARASDAELARHHLVVEHHREPRSPPAQGHQAIRLGLAQDVEGEQDVVGHARVHEDLDLSDLLARDAHGSRLHLQLSDGGNLVRLDVRTIPDAVLGEVRLHPSDVVFHDVETNGHSGGVELLHCAHAIGSRGFAPTLRHGHGRRTARRGRTSPCPGR